MEQVNQLFPITVVVAVILFLTREVIDSIKRHRAERREKEAIGSLLSEELERNYWTYKVIFRTLKEVKEYREIFPATTFHFIYRHDGSVLYRCNRNGEYEDFSNGHALVDAHEKIYERVLTEVAKLDGKLFESMQKAYYSVRRLSEFRNALISYIENEEKNGDNHFDFWLEYAVKQEEEIYSDMNELYSQCAKTDLKEHRLD